MQQRNKLKVCFTILVVFIMSSCSNEKLNEISEIKEPDTQNISKFDKFLEREFVQPYNIEVIYKYDDIETNLDYNVDPIKTEKAIQITNLIKYLCLDAYKKHTNKDFLKKNFPKKIVLLGSGAYNQNHTQLMGTAQGGVKIVLYNLNKMDPLNGEALVEDYFNTIFHEFSHILHQKKAYTKDFQKITPGYLGDSWSTFWEYDSDLLEYGFIGKGFIGKYASKHKDEDFVEIISHKITLSDEQWNAKINPSGSNDEGVSLMNKKVSVVKSYLKDSWNISLDKMRTEVRCRLDNLSNVDINNID